MPTAPTRSDGPAARAPGVLAPFAYVTPACGAVVMVAGLLVLIGWATGSPALRALLMPPRVMLPNTALGFVLAGFALLLAGSRPLTSSWRRVVVLVLGVVLALLGALSLYDRAIGAELGIGLLLFGEEVLAQLRYPSVGMATNTALALTCAGGGIAILHALTPRGWRPAELFALAVIGFGFVALVGYAYDVEQIAGPPAPAGRMAVSTAAALCLVGLGMLFALPGRGIASLVTQNDASGIFLRRTLPAAILVPVALGWLWDAADDAGLILQREAIAVFVVGIVAVFITVVLASARTVSNLDAQREELFQREQAARTEAETANRAKAEFLANMSHELRTPLNAITGYADLLDLELRGPLTVAQREDVTRIRRSSQYLLGLINDTLNFARLEAGRVEIAPEDLPLHETLAGMEALISPQVTARSLWYEYRPCEPDLFVRADRERLEQILVNLLTNACKFTEPGGHVTLSCERRVRHVRIAVRDTGRGIPAEKLDTIFEPFIQIDRHLTHESQQGVGLGLSISRDLARAMGGDLAAESQVGAGSTFVLTLPRAHRPAGTPQSVAELEAEEESDAATQ